jgi:hypothetical protein
MKPRARFLRRVVVIGILALAASAYAWAYHKVPLLRCPTGGMRVVQMRCFGKDFQPYFFAPAGRIEALMIRWRQHGAVPPACGEVVDLCTQHVRLRFRATPDLPPTDAPLPYGTDILTFAQQHPPYAETMAARGLPPFRAERAGVLCNYSDCDIDEAEAFLRDKFSRPYTIGRVLRWYGEEHDEQTRSSLLVVLGASRDPRAALALAAALRSTNHRLRITAVNALSTNFGPNQCAGGGNLESTFANVDEWLDENERRLRAEAMRLPLH